MKTMPLRDLMRRPTAVKKLTAKGESVRITDNGNPLWVLQPDTISDEVKAIEDKVRQDWMDEYFAEFLAEEPQKGKSMAEIVSESRGNA